MEIARLCKKELERFDVIKIRDFQQMCVTYIEEVSTHYCGNPAQPSTTQHTACPDSYLISFGICADGALYPVPWRQACTRSAPIAICDLL